MMTGQVTHNREAVIRVLVPALVAKRLRLKPS